MTKIIANSVFTALLLVASFFGVRWSKDVTKTVDSSRSGEIAVAGIQTDSISKNLPLEATIDKSVFHISETQSMNIQTLPNANISISTFNPKNQPDYLGTINGNADENGNYALDFSVNDTNSIGLYRSRIEVTLNGDKSSTELRYILKDSENTEVSDNSYTYPLIP